MKCPACENELSAVTIGDVEVDVCKGGCGGVWFDRQEIESLDEPHEFPGSGLFDIERGGNVRLKTGPRKCPRCADEVLVRQFFDVNHQVEIDQCWECSGIWMDVGELGTIRSQYATMDERKAAVSQYVGGCMAGHQEAIKELGQEKMVLYEKRTKNTFAAFANELRQLLLGEDDLA